MNRPRAARCWFVLALVLPIAAAWPSRAEAQPAPFGILDNSFLVEEAFNQEKGIVQNIFVWTRDRSGGWDGNFTQEWPAPTMAHQLSYSVPFAGGNGTPSHVGATLLNYRYQLLSERPGRPAFSPRASVILPTGRRLDDTDRPGVQINLPFSKQAGDIYVHWNAGVTWLHDVPLGPDDRKSLTSPQLAASLIWNARPLLNLMLESVVAFDEQAGGRRTEHQRAVTVSPGLRGGWNRGEQQIILGAAMPVTVVDGETELAVLAYASYELPFLKNR